MRDIGRGKATGTCCRRLRFRPHRLEYHISGASELPTHASRQTRTFRAGSLIGKNGFTALEMFRDQHVM